MEGILAIDPAGPIFATNTDLKLGKDDAKAVQARVVVITKKYFMSDQDHDKVQTIYFALRSHQIIFVILRA